VSADVQMGAVVVGAGVAGLGAGLGLERGGNDVLVLDDQSQPGGVIRTDSIRGFRVERGANTCRIPTGLHRLLADHGLGSVPVQAAPEGRSRWLYVGEKLESVPLSAAGLVRTGLLSGAGKRRLLREPFVGRGDGSKELVSEFIDRRLGPEATKNLVGPFLTGVYAGDVDQLGAAAVFPGLVEAEQRSGSILLGSLTAWLRGRISGRPAGRTGSWSSAGGMSTLVRALADRLAIPPRQETRVRGVFRDGAKWRIEAHGPDGDFSVSSAVLVLAMPAHQGAELVRGVDAELARKLDEIVYSPLATLAFGIDPQDIRASIEGFGFLVSREANLGLLGCLYMSRLFPDRAPSGSELLHCMVGGVGWPEAVDLPDDLLRKRVVGELDRVLGLRAEPELLRVGRWPKAVAQPGVDHVRRVAEIRRRVAAHAGLGLAGGYLAGVSVADALLSGEAEARTISATRSAHSR